MIPNGKIKRLTKEVGTTSEIKGRDRCRYK